MDVMKQKTTQIDASNVDLQEKIKKVRDESSLYNSESRGALTWLTASYNESKARSNDSEKDLVKFYVAKRQIPSKVNGLRIEQTTSQRKAEDFEYRLEEALAKTKRR